MGARALPGTLTSQGLPSHPSCAHCFRFAGIPGGTCFPAVPGTAFLHEYRLRAPAPFLYQLGGKGIRLLVPAATLGTEVPFLLTAPFQA